MLTFGRIIVTSLGIVLGSYSLASGAPIAYEPFNYAAGSLAGASGGGSTGFSNAWTGANSVTTPGFSYTDSNSASLVVAGNKATTVNSVTSFRGVTGAPTSGTFYISFLAKSDLTGSSGTNYFGLSLYAGTTSENMFLGQPNNTAFWGIDPKGGGTQALSTASSTSQSFLVYRVDFGSGTTVRLYVNPTLDGGEPAIASATATRATTFTWDTIRLQSGASAGNTGSFDEIRVGTTYADVVPEPSGIAVLAVAAAGLLAARRRSRSTTASTC